MSSSSVIVTPGKSATVSGGPKSQFRSFSHEYDNLLSDDYLKTVFTVKYTGKGQNFQVAAKETFNYVEQPIEAKEGQPEKTVDIPVFDQEVKIITNVEGRNVETKFSKKGIRTWADLGVFNVGKDINVTAKVKTDNQLEVFNGWVSGEYRGPHCNANVRFELKKNLNPYLNTRVVFTENKFRAGFLTKVGLKTFDFKRHDLFATYRVNSDLDVYLGHYVLKGDKPKDIGTIVGAAIYRLNKHAIILQGQWQKSKNAFGATLGCRSEINNNTFVRAKVNQAGLFNAVAKRIYNKNLSILLGTELNLTKLKDSYKVARTIPIPISASLEFTYN